MQHRDAIEAAVVDGRLDKHPQHLPLIELCRVLADQMDAAGAEPSTRLTAAYLSALKDLRRAVLSVPARREGGTLADLRTGRHRPAPTLKRLGAVPRPVEDGEAG